MVGDASLSAGPSDGEQPRKAPEKDGLRFSALACAFLAVLVVSVTTGCIVRQENKELQAQLIKEQANAAELYVQRIRDFLAGAERRISGLGIAIESMDSLSEDPLNRTSNWTVARAEEDMRQFWQAEMLERMDFAVVNGVELADDYMNVFAYHPVVLSDDRASFENMLQDMTGNPSAKISQLDFDAGTLPTNEAHTAPQADVYLPQYISSMPAMFLAEGRFLEKKSRLPSQCSPTHPPLACFWVFHRARVVATPLGERRGATDGNGPEQSGC